jgi:hypothetical protein
MGFGDIFLKARTLGEDLRQKLREKFQNKNNRWVVFICLGGVMVILALLMILQVVSYQHGHPRPPPPPDLRDVFKPLSIPPEELFPPEEPDFLPEVLLERGPRKEWTVEDALPFWTDPLDEHEAFWRERGEAVIDELLEGVP